MRLDCLRIPEEPMFEFHVPDLSCGHCARAVTEALQSLDAGAKVDVDLEKKSVRVETTSDEQAVAAALAEAGYPPS